jgi:hypothetical protein
MVLPTGVISMSQVNVEILRPATQTISFNDGTVRNLAIRPSGSISMGDLRGKSYFSVSGGTTAVSGNGDRLGSGSVSVTTGVAVVGSVVGGQSPYTFTWELVSGTAASHGSSGSTTFTRTANVIVGQTVTVVGVYRCKVTDATGAVIYGPNCTVTTFHNETS